MARGHVRARGKGWVYVIRHEALAKPEWSRQQPTQDAAEKLMTDRLAQLDAGQGIGGSKETVGVYLANWLLGRQQLRAASRQLYQREIERHIVPYLGDVPLAKLRPDQIAAWQGTLRKAGVSERGIAYAQTVLTMALRQAVRWGHIPRDPSVLVERPKPSSREHTWWEPEQAQAFLRATHDTDDGPLYRLALAGLLRRGELLALRWRDLDLGRRRVTVAHTVTRSGVTGSPWAVGMTKGGRSRVVLLDVETVAALTRHKERQAFKRVRSDRWVDNDLVFPNRDGGLLQFETLRLRFTKAVAGAGLPSIRFHDLRHTGTTLLLRAGVPLTVVSQMLGHANITITATTYSHISESMLDDAADAMRRMLGGS